LQNDRLRQRVIELLSENTRLATANQQALLLIRQARTCENGVCGRCLEAICEAHSLLENCFLS
jgi:hypothetical protein